VVLVCVCTPDDVITLLLPLSSAADSWSYFNYLQNEGGHSVPLESILFHCVILLHYMHEKKFLKDCISGRNQQRCMNIAQNSGKILNDRFGAGHKEVKSVMLNVCDNGCSLQMMTFSSGMQWHFVGIIFYGL